MEKALQLIIQERERQVKELGFTKAHDISVNRKGQLSQAAAIYAMPARTRKLYKSGLPMYFPWSLQFYKPNPDNRVKELVKAAALIVADIERLMATHGSETQSKEA